MKKIALINATLVDPSQKINKKGSLLIENKNISKLIFNNNDFSDQNFNRSVILLVDHSNSGSVGFVLNKKSEYLSIQL